MKKNHNMQRCFKGNGLLFKILISAAVIFSLCGVADQSTYGYTAVKGTVTASSAKARKEPSTKSSMAFGVTKGEVVTILSEEKGNDDKVWYKVQVLDSVGYLRSDLVKKSNETVKTENNGQGDGQTGQASTTDNDTTGSSTTGGTTAGTQQTSTSTVKGSNVIVREEATTKSSVRTVVQNGQSVSIASTVTGEDGKQWCLVSFSKSGNQYNGYIRSDLLNISGAEVTPQSQPDNSQGETTSTTTTPQIGKIKASGVNIRQTPVDGKVVCRLTSGNQITVTSQQKASDGNVWYGITFISKNTMMTGYVRSDFTEGITMDASLAGNDVPQDGTQSGDTVNPSENTQPQPAETTNTEEKTASIKGIGVRIREAAVSGKVVAQLDAGYPVTVTEEVTGSDNYKWYRISFSKNDKKMEGYVRSDLVTIANNTPATEVQTTDESFESQIAAFPEDYKVALRELHTKYPNWQFVPVVTNLEWNDVVTEESKVGKNLVAKTSMASWKSTAPQAYDWTTNTWYGFDGGSWAAASTEIIQYYLDPRNFLDDSGIFQFETLGFESYQSAEGVSNVVAATFMSGDYNDADGVTRNYAQSFYEAGQACGVNPYHLASKAIQEQGTLGKSQSISGTVSGLANLFNYFNIGAFASNGRSATINGLYYAAGTDATYLRPWNTRYKSIVGSAKYIADKYISVGQNTLYFQKFNVVNTSSGLYDHQYMSNVVAASYESARMRKAYSDLNTSLVFRIPVYNNMPSEKCVKPTSDSNPNTYLSSLWVDGYTFTVTFSSVNSTYYVSVPQSVTSINIGATCVSGTSTVEGTGVVTLTSGENKLQITCRSQAGASKVYTIVVIRQ